MPRLSASKTGLAESCAFPFRDDIEYKQTVGHEAVLGTAAHWVIANTIQTQDVACAQLPEEVMESIRGVFIGTESARAKHISEGLEWVRARHATWLKLWWEAHKHEGWQAEITTAFEPISGSAIVVPTTGHRDYSSIAPGFIPGQADAIRWEGKTLHVVDWKTGKHKVAPAGINPQLKTLAVALGAAEAHAYIVYVREDDIVIDEGFLDALDLEAWRDELARIMRELPTAQPKAGPHCRDQWCPLNGRCPATSTSLVHVGGQKPRLPIVYDSREITSPEHAQVQYQTLRSFQAAANAAWGALRQYAIQSGGVPVGNGKTWMQTEKGRESIDLGVPGAVATLQEVFGDQWQNAVEFSTTKTAIEEAARKVAAETGQKIKAVKDKALTALRQVGAVTRSSRLEFEEVELKENNNE